MGKFLPLTIKLLDGKSLMVSSICEAEAALLGNWPNKEAAAYKDAGRLIAAAKDGSCNPAVAFAAFKAAAIDQRVLQPAKQSAALGMLDEVTKDLTKPV
ncbi:conserved hypothetical protein [Mesorhizobium metallidurans STM 2683]|uniref:DUF982 domain-containing protein n=1 Tax=Mesorhizobium metallidurans STM 2683 TaxID=1297569 RepID=M5ENB1_9HYPH|nr:DUF982 domain-containing protein [Mesorhizobium metallidurans]CCV05665.1 conserved hypothetical protein [Mesorhizobium metallidurans STM 2683]